MITGTVVRAFQAIGWGWGGSGTGTDKDYMHFRPLVGGIGNPLRVRCSSLSRAG
jgi:hypothetical protein